MKLTNLEQILIMLIITIICTVTLTILDYRRFNTLPKNPIKEYLIDNIGKIVRQAFLSLVIATILNIIIINI